MKLRTTISLLIIGAFGAGLAACGGGSVSSGGGSGSGGSGASSSLVVEVARDDRAAVFQQHQDQDNRLAAVISDLLISKALAQTAGVPIFVDGVLVAETDPDGSAVIPLDPGTYEVCILDPEVPENCTIVVVDPDSVVVIANVNIDENEVVTFDPPTTAPDEEVADFTDPDNAFKTIICHKPGKINKTLSVGTPAAEKGHMGHGDTMGPCSDDVAEGDEEDEEEEA